MNFLELRVALVYIVIQIGQDFSPILAFCCKATFMTTCFGWVSDIVNLMLAGFSHTWRFPKKKASRRQWDIATRRKGFSAGDCSVLCSEHFRTQDLDRTGQIIRIRGEAKLSVFSFPAHLQRVGLPLDYKS